MFKLTDIQFVTAKVRSAGNVEHIVVARPGATEHLDSVVRILDIESGWSWSGTDLTQLDDCLVLQDGAQVLKVIPNLVDVIVFEN